MKKTIGYLLILFSIFLSVALIGQISRFLTDILILFNLFNSNLDSYTISKIVTKFIFWIIHITLIYISWVYGRKWSKKN